jgi:hypothetical protein
MKTFFKILAIVFYTITFGIIIYFILKLDFFYLGWSIILFGFASYLVLEAFKSDESNYQIS